MAFGIQGVGLLFASPKEQSQDSPFASSSLTAQQPQSQQTGGQLQSGVTQQQSPAHRNLAIDPLSQLDLSSSQQTQIEQIINNAVINGDSSSDVLSAIDNVLSPAQQQTLVSAFAPSAAYTSTGTTTAAKPPPYVVQAAA